MTNSHQDNVGPSVIELELTDEMRDKQLVTQFTCSYYSKSVILKFNHKYEDKVVELYPIDIVEGKWTNTLESCEKTLREIGIDEEDCVIVRRSLNQVSEKITNHFATQRLARMTVGQKAKMERLEKKNGPPLQLSIKDVLRRHEGNFRVRGMINGLGIVEKMCKALGFRCGECDGINVKFDYTGSRPRFADEIPRLKLSEVRCICQSEDDRPPFCHEPWDDPVNALKIVLFDTETFNDLESLNVILLDDYTRGVQTGEEVIVTGSLQRVTVRGKTQSYLFVGLNPIDGVENPFEYVNRKESFELSDDDEKTVKEFLDKNKGKELDELVKLVAPSIIGNEHVKKGLLMCLVNSGKDPIWKKRRLHALSIGNPGLAKSYLAHYMTRLAGGNSIFASAADASPKSLIGVIDNDEKILRLGPIPRAHGRVLSLDEIGRMSPQDQGLILTAMQQGMVYYGRYGFNTPLPASTTFWLTCNPAGNSGQLKEKEKLKIHDYEYPIIGPLRDRIDFFFVFQTKRSMKDAMNYSFEKMRIEDNFDAVIKEEEENIRFLQKLDVLAHRLNPVFSTEARHMIQQFYAKVFSSEDSKYSPRLLDTLNNTCYAIARIKLKEIVGVDDAKEAIDFLKEQIEQHQSQINVVPYDPRDLAVEEMIKGLTGSNFKYQWTELLETVMKRDDDNGRWVLGYVGRISALGNKKKLRLIRTRLKEYASAHKDKILTLGISPLILAWKETYTGGDKAIDIDNVIDPEDAEEQQYTPIPTPTAPDNTNKEGIQGIQGTYAPGGDGSESALSALSALSIPPSVEKKEGSIEKEHHITSDNFYDNDKVDIPHKNHTNDANDKQSTARQIFDELALKNADENPGTNEVLDFRLREALISTGIDDADIDVIIEDMKKDGFVKPIVTELDGIRCEILRKGDN